MSDNFKLIDELLDQVVISRSNQSSRKSSLESNASSKSRSSKRSSSGSSSDTEYISDIEKKILRSSEPIEINETERLTLFGEEGRPNQLLIDFMLLKSS